MIIIPVRLADYPRQQAGWDYYSCAGKCLHTGYDMWTLLGKKAAYPEVDRLPLNLYILRVCG